MSLNVSLTPELESFVREKVKSGRYASSSEVVREALRLLVSREEAEQAKLADLRQAIQDGLDSGIAGPFDPERIMAEVDRRLQESDGP